MNNTLLSERDSFLPAIIADRDSDVPRLIFADWLEEHGERDRSEFIRIQCRLAKLTQLDSLECLRCEICGNRPDEDGELRHGRGCYVVCEEGGGSDIFELNERQRLQIRQRHVDNRRKWFEDDLHSVWGDKPPEYGTNYTRGFISCISISWKDWLEHWQAIRAACPLEEVRFTTSPQHNFDGFLDSENLINYVKFGNFGCSDLKITLPE